MCHEINSVPVELSKRTLLKQIGVGTAAFSSIPAVSSAKSQIDEPIDEISIGVAENEQEDLLAFTSFTDGSLVLYIASGTSSLDEAADNIVQVTEPSDGSIFNPHWEDSTTLSIWENQKVKHLTVSASGQVQETKTIEERFLPETGNIDSEDTGSVDTDQIIRPPGGGGYPDWYDDPDMELGTFEQCDSIKELDVEFCIETNSVAPKVFTKSCTGREQPLVGASVSSISITTPVGSGSVGLDLWFGVDPANGCMYGGSEIADVCFSNCSLGLNPTLAEMEDAFKQDIENAFESAKEDINDVPGPNWGNYIETAVSILATIAIMLFFAILGAVGSQFGVGA